LGIFDFLRKGKSNPPPAETAGDKKPAGDKKAAGDKKPAPAGDKKIAALGKAAADKRAQTYDRLEAIQALAEMKTPEAAAALLKRFTFSIDPSITDQDEKDLAFTAIVAAGKDVVPAVAEFCLKAEGLTLPLKVLRALLPDEEYEAELLDLLDRFDTEYARNVEPKIQLIIALQEIVSDDVRESVERFLEDVNETVRFHAVQTLFAQQGHASIEPMIKMLENEESVRVKNKVAEGLLFRGWVIPAELRDKAREALRDTGAYTIGADGKIQKSSRAFG
jgi:HEAT repeat protein